MIPEHYYRASLTAAANGWRITPAVEWTPSDVWVDYTNTAKAPGYAVWNLSLSKRFSDSLEVYADARNVADTRYVSNVNALTDFAKVSAASRKVFWPGEGRAVFIGLRLTGK